MENLMLFGAIFSLILLIVIITLFVIYKKLPNSKQINEKTKLIVENQAIKLLRQDLDEKIRNIDEMLDNFDNLLKQKNEELDIIYLRLEKLENKLKNIKQISLGETVEQYELARKACRERKQETEYENLIK